jgi:hypothetical protein
VLEEGNEEEYCVIPLFLDPRPDELFYSVCARTQDAMRFDQKSSIGRYLFGNKYTNPVVDLPSRLGHVVDTLPPGHRYTVDRLIDQCTLLPFYTPFLPPNHVARIRVAMGNRHNEDTEWLGKVMGKHSLAGMLRFCPQCVEEERADLGMCYWHRLHQIPCVLVCPVHLIMLEQSTVLTRDIKSRYMFISAEQAIQTLPAPRIFVTELMRMQLARLAEDVMWLLSHPNIIIVPGTLSLYYRSILTDRGLTTSSGRIDWKRFSAIFREYYFPELLLLLQCPLDEKIIFWFQRVISRRGLVRNPMYHLLLMQLFGYSCEAFLSNELLHKPFGDGPWLCLNPACNHFRQPVIQNTDILISGECRVPLMAIFACTCGFVYLRHGPDKSPDDRFRSTGLITSGPVWEAMQRRSSEDLPVSLIERWRRQGVIVHTMKANPTGLG